MSPCVNACGSGQSALSWLDGGGKCAVCRPELVREPIPYLHQNRPPLVPLREMAAVNRDNPFRPPVVAVERPDLVPVGAETTETAVEPLRAIKPPASTVHLDPQTVDEELAEAEQIGAATVRPLLGDALRATGGIVSALPLGKEAGHEVVVHVKDTERRHHRGALTIHEPVTAAQIEEIRRTWPGVALDARYVVPCAGHPNGQTNPPIARSRWSRAWARLLRRTT